MSNDLTIQTCKSLQDMFYSYTHLKIGKKEIVCPYWMNNSEKGIYGPAGGKGTPEEIVEATLEQALAGNINLESLDKEAIVLFMKAKKIGVDCSGFVFWMLNSLDLEKGGNGIADDIPGSKGVLLKARASVLMLTDDNISFPIKLPEVMIGDMLRLRQGRHVDVVHKIAREGKDVKEIWYAHSSSITKVTGVHEARITIADQNKEIGDQVWEEQTADGLSYKAESFFAEEKDGLRRLKIWV